MSQANHDEIRSAVRKHYGNTATGCCGGEVPKDVDACCVEDVEAKAGGDAGCGCEVTTSDRKSSYQGACCSDIGAVDETAMALGYGVNDLSFLPEGANLGLGCGNPQAIASIKEGEAVLDLGSGAGIDCFLASKATGSSGYVIGVDMTPEMIAKAKNNAEKTEVDNVEFRLGMIESLPVGDGCIDVIISNCVINLSPEKNKVFSEAFRVLKPGGRLAVSDVVLTATLPEELRGDIFLFTGCMAGASSLSDIEAGLHDAGFIEVRISPKEESREFIRDWQPGSNIEEYVVSATIEAIKPEA